MENTQLPGDVMVSLDSNAKMEREIARRKGIFCTIYLERKESELGVKKFENERAKLFKQAAKCWDLAQEGKRCYSELEEESYRRIMEWRELEKPLRQWLENEAVSEGWTEDMIQKTVEARHRDFERNQNNVQARLRPIIDPDVDFKERMLNPETRKEAITKYLVDNVNKAHFQAEAFVLIFAELDKRKAK